MSAYFVETQGLSKRYGDALRVKDVDLRVPEGAIYGFLGPNGAGKSTTLKMLLGLVHPTAGEIAVFGRRMEGKNRLEILQDVGSLIESPSYRPSGACRRRKSARPCTPCAWKGKRPKRQPTTPWA